MNFSVSQSFPIQSKPRLINQYFLFHIKNNLWLFYLENNTIQMPSFALFCWNDLMSCRSFDIIAWKIGNGACDILLHAIDRWFIILVRKSTKGGVRTTWSWNNSFRTFFSSNIEIVSREYFDSIYLKDLARKKLVLHKQYVLKGELY